MSEHVKESGSVERAEDGLLLIHYERIWDNGVDLSGDLVCEASAAGWLADQIEVGVDEYSAPDIDRLMPPDHFIIFIRGGEHGEDINVHVHNRRDPAAPRGRTYTLSGISPGVARNIIAQLRALTPQ